MSSKRFIIACGGTGGHLFPGIAVAEALLADGHQVKLLISEKKIDHQAAQKYQHLDFATTTAIAKPATLSFKMIPFLWNMWKSIRLSKQCILDFKADAVLGMGGFTSLAPIIAAKQMGIQAFVHDSNARPGRSNILASRFCNRAFIGMAAAASYFKSCSTVVTGTPVRPEIKDLPSKEIAAHKFGLDTSKTTIVVMGGSQGAHKLNELCSQTARLFPENWQMLHITGSLDQERIQAMSQGLPNVHVIGFCSDMPSVYAVADLMLTRSGASSLVEMASCGIPSILVPFPFAADDHQTRNAEVFSQAGAALLVQQKELTADILLSMIQSLLNHPQRLKEMSAASRRLAHDDAAQQIVHEMKR